MMPGTPHSSLTSARQSLWLVVMVTLCIATWALQHGYPGIRHDAVLYSLQGLARLHPTLANDPFLRFGSQDQFSLFGAIYALVIQWLGLEPAAAILTFTSQLALIACAVLLLRQAIPDPTYVGLGIVMLIAIEGFYGSRQIFSCIESYSTPRMAAEALALAGLCAAYNERRGLAWGLVVAGMVIHPLMATAGVVSLGFFYPGRQRPRLTAAVIGGGLLLLWLVGDVMPQGHWGTFGSDWLTIVRDRSPFVFLSGWSLDDWARAAIPVATLIIGAVVLAEQRARVLCQIALCTALTGLALTLVACDASKLVIFTQLQPWRWQWLAVLAAALLLPAIVAAGWHYARSGKIAVTLLVAAWWFESDLIALLTAITAVASLALNRFADRREPQYILYGSGALALMALVFRIATNLEFFQLHFMDWRIPLWLRQASCLASGGTLPVAVALLATWLAGRRYGAAALAALAIVLVIVCAGQSPDGWRRWSGQRFPPALVKQFAPWRELIPPDAEIFWSEQPLATWVLLERSSYISVSQTSGVLFSRTSAMEVARRAEALSAAVPAQSYLDFDGAGGGGLQPTPRQLQQICAAEPRLFLVSGTQLPWRPLAQLPPGARHSLEPVRLYRCSDWMGVIS